MSGTAEIILGVVILLLLLYYYFTSTYNFWKSRGVPGPKPIPLFGTVYENLSGKYSIGSYTKILYDQYPNEAMVGIYSVREPILLLNDLELIKAVLIKDSRKFLDRGVIMNEKHEPLSAHLFSVEAERWRPLRTKLTPVFTSGKLKQMFYLLVSCAEHLDQYLDQVDGQVVNVREICAKFTTDVIGACAFGLEANALADEESTFRKMGKRIFDTSFKALLNVRIRVFSPILHRIFGGYLADHKLTEFFTNLMKDTMRYRTENNVVRHDFIDLLMQLRNEPSQLGDIELTDHLLAAQLFVFFIAGFETSSSTMSNCLFELAMNHSIRDKLSEEIRQELKKTNGAITYEGIKGMKYLDKIVNETLRKYPPVTILMRKAIEPYTFPGTQVSIPKAQRIFIPIFAIQRDPKYFPEPEVFDPERFSDEAVKSRPPMAHLPFGDGPRNCIGARFGSMQTKVGLVKILQNHTVDICDQTDTKYTIDPKGFLLTPKNGVVLKVMKK